MRQRDVLLMRRTGLVATGAITLFAGLAGMYRAVSPETIGSVPTPKLALLLAVLVLPGLTVAAVVLDRASARRNYLEQRPGLSEADLENLWADHPPESGRVTAAEPHTHHPSAPQSAESAQEPRRDPAVRHRRHGPSRQAAPAS